MLKPFLYIFKALTKSPVSFFADLLIKIGLRKYASDQLGQAARIFMYAGRLGSAPGFYNHALIMMQSGMTTEGVQSYRLGFDINPEWSRLVTLPILPRYVQIETVRTCNAACIMCPLEASNEPRMAMSDALFSRVVEKIACLTPIPHVGLHGLNEPLMDKKLISRIRQLKAAGVAKVSVVSNGSLMTQEKALELIEAGISDISFSIESVDKSTFEGIRIGLKLEDVLCGIHNFVTARNMSTRYVPIRLLFTYSELNRLQYDQFRAYWLPILNSDGDTISALPIHSFGKFGLYNSDNNGACYQVFTDMHIRADGRVSMCCIDVDAEYKVGDISQDSIIEIYNSSQIRFDRHRHMIGYRHDIEICANCDQPECSAKAVSDDLGSKRLRLDLQGKYFIHQ